MSIPHEDIARNITTPISPAPMAPVTRGSDTKSIEESKRAKDTKRLIASTENEIKLLAAVRNIETPANLKMIDDLIRSGVNPNIRDKDRGATPLMWICYGNNLNEPISLCFARPAITNLISHGAEVEATNNDGQTATTSHLDTPPPVLHDFRGPGPDVANEDVTVTIAPRPLG